MWFSVNNTFLVAYHSDGHYYPLIICQSYNHILIQILFSTPVQKVPNIGCCKGKTNFD